MGNQQTGGGIETIGSRENDLFNSLGSDNDTRSPLNSEIHPNKDTVPITVVTPPEDESYGNIRVGKDPSTISYRGKRRVSLALGELDEGRKSRADIAHFPNLSTGTATPTRDMINDLLGVPKPSRSRRGSIDTASAFLLPNNILSPKRSLSPSLNRNGARLKLFDKLLSFNKSSSKLDEIEKEDKLRLSLQASPVNSTRSGRRASDGSALIAIGAAAFKISQKQMLNPLCDGTERYYLISTLLGKTFRYFIIANMNTF